MPKNKKPNRTTSSADVHTTVSPPDSTELVRPRPGLLAGLKRTLRSSWRPQPITPPTIDPELPSLSPIERSSEVLRFQILRIEYALSPSGTLREYLKFNLRLSIFLAVPALFIGTVITFVLSQVAMWSAFLLQIAVNALLTLLVLIAIGAILSGIVFVMRILSRK